jgi:sigma-B regulation protein RsbU (phosphoserine phosphatase)
LDRQHLQRQYSEILRAYLEGRGEAQLYLAQQLSKLYFMQKISPEEIVDIHLLSLEETMDVPEAIQDSFHFLMEVMIEYGYMFREHHSLRSKQQQLANEIEVAVTMQHALLSDQRPSYPDLDIGLISVPAKKMSGDYYNFIQHDDHSFSLAIADITGKGIPAALCMSMIKYAMDSMDLFIGDPSRMLYYLNGIVERNIDPSMFVTMICGKYDVKRHLFRYGVAGHEPAILYRAHEQKFHELPGQGIALGVKRNAVYPEMEVELLPGDLLILLTDGVTDRKVNQRYLQREELFSYIQKEIGNPAQIMVDNLYRKLLEISSFELPDDHTMIVLKRRE